jgi:hypothetical protein
MASKMTVDVCAFVNRNRIPYDMMISAHLSYIVSSLRVESNEKSTISVPSDAVTSKSLSRKNISTISDINELIGYFFL